MRTLTHQLLAAYIQVLGGEAAWAAMQQMAGTSAARETECHRIVELLKQLSLAEMQPLDEVLYGFGTYLMSAPLFALRAPDCWSGCATARDFFLARAELLERLVLRELEDTPAHIWAKDCALNLVEVGWQGRGGPLRLCRLLAGMMVGVCIHFKTPYDLRELACQSLGAPACRLAVRFPTLTSTDVRPLTVPTGRQAFDQVSIPASQTVTRGGFPRADEATREETDLAVLTLLAVKVTRRPLTLQEIKRELERLPFTAAYARREGLLALSVARLSSQGLVVGAPPPPERGGDSSALEYRVTPAGVEHLRLLDQHAAF